MKPFKSIVVISVLCVGMTACQSNTTFSENMLSSSGFKPVTPTTPAQVASLQSLPPHKLTQTTHKVKTAWVHADPTVCGCLYVGNQAAYDAYSKRQTQRAMIDMTSVTAPSPSGQWDLSPWPEL